MTEFAPPQRAGLDFPHDKHGNRVEEGNVVELVYMGTHHKGVVVHLDTDEHGVHYAHIPITIKVPVTATSKRADENPDAGETEGSKVEHRSDEGKKE